MSMAGGVSIPIYRHESVSCARLRESGASKNSYLAETSSAMVAFPSAPLGRVVSESNGREQKAESAVSLSPSERAMIPARRAAEIAGISRQRLWYWEDTKLIEPSVHRKLSSRNVVRLYTLDRLLELVVAATLVNSPGISLQHLRQILSYLREKGGYEAPLRELRFALQGREVFFQHPDGSWEGSRRPSQLVARQLIDLDEIRDVIQSRLRRAPQDKGKFERRRKVLASKPVFAGTRVPFTAVASFIEAGATDEEILEAFPNLDRQDVGAARERVAAAS